MVGSLAYPSARQRPQRSLPVLLLVLLLVLSSIPFVGQRDWAQPNNAQDVPAGPIVGSPITPSVPVREPQTLASPHVVDAELGNGRRMATVHAAPVRYQGKDGTWQPIDPRFVPVANGFVNERNLLHISAGERLAALQLRHGSSVVGWEPQAVGLQTGDNLAPLATPLPPGAAQPGTVDSDGRTIRYHHSWSLPGLVEELVAGPGEVEQSLVFAQRPNGTGETLTFRATIHLQPDHTLHAVGQQQPGSFTTDGAVEIRDKSGKIAFQFARPWAYEQRDRRARVGGTYRLTPLTATEWQLAVETPWAWWADPARVYPAVLDPTMLVLQPTDVRNIDEINCTGYSDQDTNTEPVVGIGQGPQGSFAGGCRALVRFANLPVLPPGYAIERAELVATAVRGAHNFFQPQGNPPQPWSAIAEVEVFQVNPQGLNTNWWTSNEAVLSNPPALLPTPLSDPEILVAPLPGKSWFGERWVIQNGPAGAVQQWLTDPETNRGLLLKGLKEEPCTPENFKFCDFVQVARAAAWQDATINSPDNFLGGKGFMLQIIYAPPKLSNATPYRYTGSPQPPTQISAQHARTYHSYSLPPRTQPDGTKAHWTAVGVKGLQRVQQPVPGSAQPQTVIQPAGNLPIGRIECPPGYMCGGYDKLSTGDYEKQPNYLMIGRDDFAGRVDVHPPSSPLGEYVVESVNSVNLPGSPPSQFGPNSVYQANIAISSTHVLVAYNLPLVANTRVKIDLINPGNVQARLFSPKGVSTVLTKGEGKTSAKALTVGADEGGMWGLVLEYAGDIDLPVYVGAGTTIYKPGTIDIPLKIRACGLDSFPTAKGCECFSKPDAATPRQTVGPFNVYAKAGFDYDAGLKRYTTKPNTGVGQYCMPLIGWENGDTTRLIGIAQDRVNVKVAPEPLSLDTEHQSLVLLIDLSSGNPATFDILEVWQGRATGVPQPGQTDYGYLLPTDVAYAGYGNFPVDTSDLDMVNFKAQNGFKVNARQGNGAIQQAEGYARLVRRVETSTGVLEPLAVRLDWTVRAEGYPPLGQPTVSKLSGPNQLNDVAGLELRFNGLWSMAYEAATNKFTDLRHQGSIVQPPELGAAWRPVGAVILPNGQGLPAAGGGITTCAGNCVDLRNANNLNNRTWELPDLEVTGQAKTVALGGVGKLAVWSTDHPTLANGDTIAGIPFSFRNFGGNVTVSRGTCPGYENEGTKTIIAGDSTIALPGLGTGTNATTAISASFTLCNDALRNVHLSYQGPPNIPVGPTTIELSYVSGDVTIGPDNTVITLAVDYQAGGGQIVSTPKQTSIVLNTDGLFDIQTKGTMLKGVAYDGHAWVAWSPLDVGLDVVADYQGILTGRVKAHAWKGQGWQGQYSWLPPNDDFHFSGSIQANITLPKGVIFGGVEAFGKTIVPAIPSGDLPLGTFTIAFGQFCKSDACNTGYEWGAKIVVEVLGFDVGVYYGFDSSGVHFILGSDEYKLVDQGPGLATAAVQVNRDVPYTAETLADPAAPNWEESLNVSQHTGSFMVILAWESGLPTFTLLSPDNVEITPANAAANGLQVHTFELPHSVIYTMKNPKPGTWKARVSNATPTDNYHFSYFANRRVPAITGLAPGGDIALPNSGNYTLSWQPPAVLPPGADLRVNLYYTRTNTLALTRTQAVQAGTIVEDLPISQTAYTWDLSFLGSGSYQVYAVVTDGAKHQPTKTALKQLPGSSRTAAPGRLIISDLVPPAVPNQNSILVTQLKDALQVCWTPNQDHDLSGYVVRYTTPNIDGVNGEHRLRLHATVPFSAAPATPRECTRIGGLNIGKTINFSLAAYDASGNLSGYTPPTTAALSFLAPADVLPPSNLVGTVPGSGSVTLFWTPPPGGTPRGGGYKLYWSGTATTTAPTSPMTVGPVTTKTVDGLAGGCTYTFAVQTYDGAGRLSSLGNKLVLTLTNGVDGDGDGLLNREEWDRKTDPQDRDSDDDTVSDGVEVACGSNPLDPQSLCVGTPGRTGLAIVLPRLQVAPKQLVFRAYTRGPDPQAEALLISNGGGGRLEPIMTASAPWLQVTRSRLGAAVTVHKQGLGRGLHSSTITISGAPGSRTEGSPQVVQVYLWLYEGTGTAVPNITATATATARPPEATATQPGDPSSTPTATPPLNTTATPVVPTHHQIYLPFMRR